MRRFWEKLTPVMRRIRDEYGFYVSLAVCLALIGGAAFALRNRPVERGEAAPTPAPAAALPDVVQTLEEAQKDANGAIWPIGGRTILTPHSPLTPVWSDTLGQWQAHEGLDIEGITGEVVRAVLEGTVAKCYTDPLMGQTVEVLHADGLTTVYQNLSTSFLVREGEYLPRGQALGAIGQSAAIESQMAPHLHFEAWRDGAWADILP